MSINDPLAGRTGIPKQSESTGCDEPLQDLCSNCENAETHARRGRPKRPIYFCEEFEVSSAAPSPGPDHNVREPRMETHSASGRMGLCVNCENAATCCLPKPDGGIWHCEEYQ
ncbi:MAG TPA: hypothetical protein PL151_03485 [Phycisphaerae bacterium]|nr:hypothetical protein [Phycisphaerae bacterium]HOJ75584.1 hypothetical protein [Phycisphaerae bacterium]HOM50238.1 hypothetical protein [Phycisphaerae bacterium]HON64863.1 hypothetical protein [Phycisphaerae bacterium]HOQ85389.1 hypothetical protein [Phycisphaerae bacterium]